MATDGTTTTIAFDLCGSYWRTGYWVYRELFARVLGALLDAPVLTTNAPLSAQVALREQRSPSMQIRWLVHVTSFYGGRRSPEHLDFYEDPRSLPGVEVSLRHLPGHVRSVHMARSGEPLQWRTTSRSGHGGESVTLTLGEVLIHDICVITFDAAHDH